MTNTELAFNEMSARLEVKIARHVRGYSARYDVDSPIVKKYGFEAVAEAAQMLADKCLEDSEKRCCTHRCLCNWGKVAANFYIAIY